MLEQRASGMIEYQNKASEEMPASKAGDTFFRLYEDRFASDFRRAYRDVTKAQAEGDDITLDPKALYRALFLPGELSDAGNTLRQSFRALAETTEEAEAVLRRTWMIMATHFLDYRLKNGGNPEDVSALQDMLEEYSGLLNDVYLDMSRSVELEIPDIDRNSDVYRQVVRDFREYTLEECPQELKDRLRIFTCFRGVPVDSPAEVVSIGELEVTFRVSATQAAILRRMGLALIESPLHGAAYRAYSSNVDVSTREVTFSHIIAHDEPMERRRYPRITPECAVEATVRKAPVEFTGTLVDVSAVAAAVFLRNVDLTTLSEGDEVELNVWLPRLSSAGEFSLNIPGRLEMIHSDVGDDPNAYRVVVQIPGNAEVFDQIARFISDPMREGVREHADAETID